MTEKEIRKYREDIKAGIEHHSVMIDTLKVKLSAVNTILGSEE